MESQLISAVLTQRRSLLSLVEARSDQNATRFSMALAQVEEEYFLPSLLLSQQAELLRQIRSKFHSIEIDYRPQCNHSGTGNVGLLLRRTDEGRLSFGTEVEYVEREPSSGNRKFCHARGSSSG